MNFELFYIRPESGWVVEIYTLDLYHHFLTGYCRRVIKTPTHLHFLGGFKRESTIDLKRSWAVLYEWESVSLKKASIGFIREQPWMRLQQLFEEKTR